VRESSKDFVWAVRLSKIHKRATYTMRKDKFDVAAVLRDGGIDEFTESQDNALGEALAILPER
jgi:hypothetical protein